MEEATQGTDRCQECGGPKDDVNMALCDQCFWEHNPHTAFGGVVERREARREREQAAAAEERCPECGGPRGPYELMSLCGECYWRTMPDGPIKAPPPATKPEGATGQEPTDASTRADRSTMDGLLGCILVGAERMAKGEMTHQQAWLHAIAVERLHEELCAGAPLPTPWQAAVESQDG